MCQVSNKLKLCTCAPEALSSKENYWEFYRFDKKRNFMVVGEVMLPVFIDRTIHALNKETLLQLLNEGNAFDVELYPKTKDRLALHFLIHDGRDIITYGFVFEKGRWNHCDYDSIEWMWKHEEVSAGEITDPLIPLQQ